MSQLFLVEDDEEALGAKEEVGASDAEEQNTPSSSNVLGEEASPPSPLPPPPPPPSSTQPSITSVKTNEKVIATSLQSFFVPLVHKLDTHVESLRLSQFELSDQITSLLSQIGNVYEEDRKKLDLDESAKRLIAARKRLNTVQATIIAVQERVNRIHRSVQT